MTKLLPIQITRRDIVDSLQTRLFSLSTTSCWAVCIPEKIRFRIIHRLSRRKQKVLMTQYTQNCTEERTTTKLLSPWHRSNRRKSPPALAQTSLVLLQRLPARGKPSHLHNTNITLCLLCLGLVLPCRVASRRVVSCRVLSCLVLVLVLLSLGPCLV